MKNLKNSGMDYSVTKNNEIEHQNLKKEKTEKRCSECSWLKRTGVLLLSLVILLTADPAVAEVFVMAEEESNVDCVITSFMPLQEDREEQIIAVGTPLDELQFPDTLEAVCTYKEQGGADSEQENEDKVEEEEQIPDKPEDDMQTPDIPGEEEQIPDDSETDDPKPDDSNENVQPPENPDTEGQPDSPDTGEQPPESGEGTQQPGDSNTGEQPPEQPGESTQQPGDSNTGEQPPEQPGESTQQPGDSNTGEQSPEQPDDAEAQKPEQPDMGVQAPESPETQPENGNQTSIPGADTQQVTFVDKMDHMISTVKDKLLEFSGHVTVEENHVEIEANMSEGSMDQISEKTMTDSVDREFTEVITISPVTWTCITDYDSETPGCYIFTPLFPDHFVVAEGVHLPEIVIIVSENGAEDAPVDKEAEEKGTRSKALLALTEPVTSGTLGTGLTWNYENGTLTISGSGDMPDFDTTIVPWDNFGDMIQTIRIGSGVTGIGSFAFFDCAALTSVSIPDGVKTIGSSAFNGCSKLGSVTIPGSVNVIGDSAFHGCSSLGNIIIPDSVNTIGNQAFYGCTSLTMIEIPASVSSASAYSFRKCPNLFLYYPASLSGTLGAARNTKANISYAPVSGGIRLEVTGISSGLDAIQFPASVGGGTVYSANWDAEICKPVTITHKSYPDHNYVSGSTACAICGYEAVPDINIDYLDELLTGFAVNETYLVEGQSYTFSTADADGKASLKIKETWFGKIVTIAKQKNGQNAGEALKLAVPARPAPPANVEAKDAGPEGTGGQLINVDSTMEYRVHSDDDTSTAAWMPVSGSTVDLSHGSYDVRVKAVADKSFCSLCVTVEIGQYELQKEQKPQAKIDYKNETLTGLTANAVYRIGIRQGTTDSDITYEDIAALTGGIIKLDSMRDPSWFGQTLLIIKAGIRNSSVDSDPQILSVPRRPDAPAGVGSVDASEKKNDGKLTGVNSKMEYRKKGSAAWQIISGSTVSGLTPGEYEIRLKATSTQFASEITTQFIASADMPKEPLPDAGINYMDETLTGLTAGSEYRINDIIVTARADGCVDLEEEWIGSVVSIIKAGNKSTTTDSDAQMLEIPQRPKAPVGVKAVNVTAEGADDGRLTGVDTGMEYREAEDDVWRPVNGTEVKGLAPGIYVVCYKATATSFRSVGVELTVIDFLLKAENMPAAKIDYVKETLISLISGKTYQIDYDGAFSGSNVLQAGANGIVDIDEEWFDSSLSIVALGDGIRTRDSEAQGIEIPARPDAPEGIVSVDISGTNTKSGKLQNVKNTMEYQKEGDLKWTAISGTVVSGLTSGAYLVRYKAVSGKSFCSESTRCTITAYELTAEPTPAAEISFSEECLMYLTPGAYYKVNGVKVQADDRGMIPIRAAWMNGKNASIIQTGDGLSTSDSEKQSILIPKRPTAPGSVKAVSESEKDACDGKLTGVKDTMEYRKSGSEEWIFVYDTVVENLEPGKYEIRHAATEQSFASPIVTRIVYAFGTEPPETEEKQEETSEKEEPSGGESSGQDQSSSQNDGSKDNIAPAGQKKEDESVKKTEGNEETNQDDNKKNGGKKKEELTESQTDGNGQNKTEGSQKTQASSGQTDENTDSGKETSDTNMNGAASDIGKRTMLFRLGDGKVSVTIENEALSEVVLTDTAAAVMAVLSKEETDRVLKGEEAEILVSIKRIDGQVSLSDQQLIDRKMEELQNSMPDPAICMYLDISIRTRIEGDGWKTAEEIEEPIDITIHLPADLSGQYSDFYALRVHDGTCQLLEDVDEDEDTITIQTHLFSTYAVLHNSGNAYVYTERMEKNMSVFMDFMQRLSDSGALIWIAVILAEPILFLLLLIYAIDRKNRNKECRIEN